MKKIIGFLQAYIKETDKRTFLLSALFTATAIFLNYHYDINGKIADFTEVQQYISWFLIFLISFSFPYLLQKLFKNKAFPHQGFTVLLILAPAIFAWKMSGNVHFTFSANEIENNYWNHVVYWPFKLLVVAFVLFIIWKIYDKRITFYGLSTKNLELKPYIIMLLLMMPLIAIASTQPDFLTLYPKLKTVSYLSGKHDTWLMLLYELSYGSDFFTIELFFRGFLIIAFAKWVGKDAVLPMAVFYCTIHFGKPLGECISSFFGGIILGVITYHTQTIYGGLIVHLGIAWMMELAGYLSS